MYAGLLRGSPEPVCGLHRQPQGGALSLQTPRSGLFPLRPPGLAWPPQTPRHSPLALDTRRAAPRVTPCPPAQHLATFIMDKSEAITSVEDAIRKLVQLSSKEKIWTQEMLLQVNDQSLRLLDMESQVPRREEGAGWSCQAGGGSDPGALGLSVGPEGGGQRAGGPGRAGVRGATPTGHAPLARALRGWTEAGERCGPGRCRPRLCAGPFWAVSVARPPWAHPREPVPAPCPPGGAGELPSAQRAAQPDGAQPAALPVSAAARVPGRGPEQARRPLLPLRRGGGRRAAVGSRGGGTRPASEPA